LDGISGLKEDQYTLSFNIDGISWLYQVSWKKDKKILKVERTICGGEPLEKGTLESFTFNPKKEQYALSFSSADLPTQIFKQTSRCLESQTIFFQRGKTLPSNPMTVCECLPDFIYLVKT
jgi:hypothetical protein